MAKQYNVVHQQDLGMNFPHTAFNDHVKPTTLKYDQARDWSSPRPLRKSNAGHIASLILDVILLLLAAAFLGLAILVLYMTDLSTTTPMGATVEQAMKIGPSIYPILFAAIVGRALKGIARFRAERGSRISTLWPLLNSRTIFDSFMTQWHLAQFSFVASFLVILWSLSPLGGQASLRLMNRVNVTSAVSRELRYLDTGPLGNMFANGRVLFDNAAQGTEGDVSTLPVTMPALYDAAILQDAVTKAGPLDIWGNVKIPRPDKLDHSKADEDGWIDVPSENVPVETYASLLGLPIVNLPTDGVVDFTVESAHVVLSKPTVQNFTGRTKVTFNDGGTIFSGLRINCLECPTSFYVSEGDPVSAMRQHVLWGPPAPQLQGANLTNMTLMGSRNIKFESHTEGGSPGTGLSTLITEVKQQLVESHIQCIYGRCRAIRVRASRTDHRPENVTTFDYWGVDALEMIMLRTWTAGSFTSTSTELFINDSSLVPISRSYGTDLGNMANLSRVDPQLFADRATMVLNTALGIFMAPSGYLGGLPTNVSLYGLPHAPADGVAKYVAAFPTNKTLPGSAGLDLATANLDIQCSLLLMDSAAPFVAASTTANVTKAREVFRPDYAWVAMLMISSVVLIITGIWGMCLGSQARAPDVFDPLMAFTFDHQLQVPPAMGVLSATERVRLLAGMQVSIGDVRSLEEVGKVGIGNTGEVTPLVQGRLYE